MTKERLKQYRTDIKKLSLLDCAKIDELVRERSVVRDALDKIPDIRHRGVLELYYIEGLTWKQVAECMSYSLRWVMKLHRAALKQLKEEAQDGN